jgi:hypothetical protein
MFSFHRKEYPMHRHKSDPEAPFRAAAPLARLIAAGLLDYPECLAALTQAALTQAAGAQAAGAADAPSGLRTRLAHALTDAVTHWELRRSLARREIAHALAPSLAARARSTALLNTARAENRALGHPLRDVECAAIARQAAARHFSRA